MTEENWLNSTDPTAMLEFLRSKTSNRKLRLFACACCRRIWHLLSDERSQEAVAASERFADRLIHRKELVVRRQEAMLGKRSFDYYIYPAENAAASVACASIKVPWILWLTEAALGNHTVLTGGGSTAAVNLPLREEIRQKEKRAQTAFLQDVAGNPFRPVTVDPNWQTSTVVQLAQAAYNERHLPAGTLDNARLAVIADALEEAGCDNIEILKHCQGPGPHLRGCWALDAVLGKV